MSNVEDIRNRVSIHQDKIGNVSSTSFPNNYTGYDDSFNLDSWKKEFNCKIMSMSPIELEFDLIGVDASIANAIRRYIVAEVPSICIEEVYSVINDGVMQDEVLAHRLGLIPLKIDARHFDYKDAGEKTDLNTVVFHLNITCKRKAGAAKDVVLPEDKYDNSNVLASDLIWQPQGDQQSKFKTAAACDKDVLITKLRPGQTIQMELHAVKGVGKDHAKFSSLGYRLLPEIRIVKPITGPDAVKFQKCFVKGVVGIKKDSNGVDIAVVEQPRLDTVSRECLRHPEFEGKVLLSRKRDHFIFNTESVGSLPPQVIVTEALKGLIEKIGVIREAVDIL